MELNIYIICLGVGFLFTLASAVFGHFFGGGHDGDAGTDSGHAEASLDAHDMPGISAYSPTIIASFVTAFGGLGIIFHEIPATTNPAVSAPLALIGAFIIAYILLKLLRKLFQATQSSSESKVAELVGVAAHVITPIPENGVGEIAYVAGGSRYTAPAREENGRAVPNGKAVKILRIIGSQFYVAAN